MHKHFTKSESHVPPAIRTFLWNALFILVGGNIVPAIYYFYFPHGNQALARRVWIAYHYVDLRVSVFVVLMVICSFSQRHRISAMFSEFREGWSLERISWDVLIGSVTGVLIALTFLPIAAKPQSDRLLAGALISALVGLRSLRFVLTLAIVLPIFGEIVFRQIIMKSLMQRVDRLNAILMVGSLFAFSWPVLWFWISLALGIAVGILYYTRRSVVACIAANVAVTTFLGVYLVYKNL